MRNMIGKHKISLGILIKSGLILTWVLLFGLLLQRDYFITTLDTREAAALERAERTEYQSIYFKNSKIGYVENQFMPEGEMLIISQKAVMRLNIGGQTHPVDLRLTAKIHPDSRLDAFNFDFTSPFYKMKAHGNVTGNSITFQLDTGNNTIEDRISLDEPPLISTSRRAYLLTRDLEAGDKVRIPWFDPVSLTAKSSIIEYRGKEPILILDRVYHLHHFVENFSGARINSWLDDDGHVVKEESPAGFVFIREPEFKAKKN